ncbi:putative Major facilitator superfamily (MFS) profile domain-containing protein [Seiridium unicorne]|uniref:Major facilitator superfamily (MFS) profile domain-containing protein n=1 Tax=Seiridium unicorne TaxID=138068 RepID=A0ABR2UQM5_9PEZI
MVPDASQLLPSDSVTSNLQVVLLLGGLFCGVFVMALDATIIGTVVPIISTEFNALDDIAWYGSGYLLTITALQPTFGKLYRIVNVKWAFMACVVVFEVGSVLCAAAPSSVVFIIGRAVAGAGAAGLFQGALAIITKSVSLQKRPLCISMVTSAFAVSVCIGPPIGGALADSVTWRWAFWINVPIGAVVLVLIFFLLRLPKEPSNTSDSSQAMTIMQKVWKLDPVGALLIVAAVTCILLALQWGGQSKPWNSSSVIGLLVGFVLILGVFFWTQWRLGDDATLPLWIFRRRSLLAGALFSFFFSMPSYVYGTYIPIYFQAVRASSVLDSGVQFLALAIPQIFGVVFTGALVSALGFYVPFMTIGTAIGLLGSGLFLELDIDTPRAVWAVILVVCGLGTGFAINLPYTVVQAILTEDEVPIGNGINPPRPCVFPITEWCTDKSTAAFQFMFQLGASISLSIGQTIFLNTLKSSAQQIVPSIPYSLLVSAGAYDLRKITGSDALYELVRRVYIRALHDTYIYPIVAAGVALLTTLALENKSLKVIQQEREAVANDKERAESRHEGLAGEKSQTKVV